MRFLTLLFTLCTVQLFAQSYLPVVEEGKWWQVDYPAGMGSSIIHEYYVGCDTVLNGLSYKKVMLQTGPSTEIVFGYAREDTASQKVYFRKFDMADERLAMDFQLAVGDTFTTFEGYAYPVLQVSYAMMYGAVRKTIQFGPSVLPFGLTEGVGMSMYGLCKTSMAISYSQISQFDTIATLCTTSDVATPNAPTQIKVFPNPFFDHIQVEWPMPDAFQEFSLSDISGKTVWTFSVANRESIALPTLPDGVYFMKNRQGDTIRLIRQAP